MKRFITLGLCLFAPVLTGVGAAQTNPTATPTKKDTPSASNYVTLGRYYYSAGQYDSAYIAYKKAYELDAKSNEALLGLARSQLQLKLYSAAIESFKKLIQTDSKNTSAYIGLARAYSAQYRNRPSQDRDTYKNNLDDALRILGDAETLDPKNSAIFNEKALLYRDKDDMTRAVENAKKAVSLDPNNSTILSNYGRILLEAGDSTGALDALQKAVIANPKDATSKALYARMLAQKGDIKTAQVEVAQAQSLSPKSPYVLLQSGVINYLAKDTSAAKTSLDKVLQIDGLAYPEAHYYMGRMALDDKNNKEAHSSLTKAVALDPNNAEYRFYFGKVLELMGDKANARTQYQSAVIFNPEYKEAKEAVERLK